MKVNNTVTTTTRKNKTKRADAEKEKEKREQYIKSHRKRGKRISRERDREIEKNI